MSALGDDIIRLSQGKEIRNGELLALYGTLPERREGPPLIAPIRYRFKPSPLPKPYLTYQFDKSFDQRTWAPEHIFTNRQHHAIYHHYRSLGFHMVDIGHRRYDLETAADIINGSEGHVGVCSGMGWFAIACGKKPVIWYATEVGSPQLRPYIGWWKLNGAGIRYFDQSFEWVDCDVAVDGKRYSYCGE